MPVRNQPCPWCNYPYEFDLGAGAFPYECPQCGQLASPSPLRQPPQGDELPPLGEGNREAGGCPE